MSDKGILFDDVNNDTLDFDLSANKEKSNKPKSPLHATNDKTKNSNVSFIAKYWPHGLGAVLVVGMISLLAYEPSNDSTETQKAMVINQPVKHEQSQTDSGYIERPQSSEQVANLSKILVEQKKQIDLLQEESEHFKVALTQHKQAIQQLQQDRNLSTPQVINESVKVQSKYPSNILLNNMSLNDISGSIAWIKYQGKTHAIQVGDLLGSVRVISIDPQERIVITNKGLIK
ncbi:hypothetical protein [Xenorhabdus sp. KJ12.1]|uniref:hypothetical protein n=1 Tax=Xenorhabdus sp. KJ12.1 TaxID=1851571 RepID=UPI000C03999C|nr:hypothetical protein [Xenorhabdus sp. KJ12.1]PHM67995.1 hypothetical protein Xekj_03718 [Xenorhabdus sp. KJ12.1]